MLKRFDPFEVALTTFNLEIRAFSMLLAILVGSLAMLGCAGGSGNGKYAIAPPSDTEVQLRRLIDEARFEEAESSAREALAAAQLDHGEESVQAGRIMDLLVETLWRARKATEPETLELAERAVKSKEIQVGPDHPEVARSLLNLGVVLEFSGDAAAAEPVYRRAVEIREDALGPEAPELAKALYYLGNMYFNTRRYPEARESYERVLSIRETALGPDHPEVAMTLNNLANLLHQVGEYEESEASYRRALAITERANGPEHLDVAWVLNGLAGVLYDSGDYEESVALYERALKIRETHLGPDHMHVAWTLNNIGTVWRDLGDYSRARSTLERALTIEENLLGPDHPDVAVFLNNLADLLLLMGDYEDSLEMQQHVLAVRVEAHGPDDATVGRTLQKIALIRVRMGDHAKAAENYERVLEIYEQSLGPEHPEFGTALGGLARVRRDMGQVSEAHRLLSQSLSILEESLGRDHPKVADSLEDLASATIDVGDAEAAEPLYRRALRIRETALGPLHPLVGHSQVQLGTWLAMTGDPGSALELALDAEEIGRKHLLLTIETLPERQALRYSDVRASGLDLVLQLAASGGNPEITRRAWNALCRSRALVLDEMAARQRVRSRSDDPKLARLTEELSVASRRLANLSLRGVGSGSIEEFRALLDAARVRKENAERALAEGSLEFRKQRAGQRVGLDEVARQLPKDAALVAFARFRRPQVVTDPENESSSFYLAFVQSSTRPQPDVVPLGEASEMDALVDRWRVEAAGGFVERRSSSEAERVYREVGAALRAKAWDPIESLLGGAKRVFLVPDGELNLVNFSALPIGSDRYLIEAGPVMHLLSSELDLVAFASPRSRGDGLLALGGPAYNHDGSFGEVRERGDVPLERGTPNCTQFANLRFPALPASGDEAREIVALWDRADESSESVLLLGTDASEAAFKAKAPGRRVLHIATHGFFLGQDCPSLVEGGRGVGGLSSRQDSTPRVGGESPLLLSGLALAGANRRQEAALEEEDGILTAEEIAAMDLGAAEWAVLSACDTGVGTIRTGEGVFGLRRAFQVAGAGTIIMSLWPVGDEMARSWMKELYEARIVHGRTTAEAVHRSSLALLQRRRENDEGTHPFHWAAFVAAGDWQ